MEIQEGKEKGRLGEPPQTSTSTRPSPAPPGTGSPLGVERPRRQTPLCLGTPLPHACAPRGAQRSCWGAETAGYGYRQGTAWIPNLHPGETAR